MSFIYLASPYTNPDDGSDKAYRHRRFIEACTAAARLMSRGLVIFSPIAHSHPISDHLASSISNSHAFWLEQDFSFLARCERLMVLRLYQWQRSYGVAQEMKFATDHSIPIEYVDPDKL